MNACSEEILNRDRIYICFSSLSKIYSQINNQDEPYGLFRQLSFLCTLILQCNVVDGKDITMHLVLTYVFKV